MNKAFDMRADADIIIKESIAAVLPDEAVAKALKDCDFGCGKIYMVAAGKAAWQMGKAAADILGDKLHEGIVVTKYQHVLGDIPHTKCFEAGHPVPDDNSFLATEAAIEVAKKAIEGDTVIFLLSGGGSALFEKPMITGEELADITKQLLACGADIVEMNTIRKRLSMVKGGKFANICAPARVYSVVLSDILGDPLDMIASGPAYPDTSTCEQAIAIAEKYNLRLSDEAKKCVSIETPKALSGVETMITGSVSNLCKACADSCKRLGYEPVILTDMLTCEAKEAGSFLSAMARTWINNGKSMAFIAGGETVVHLTGTGKGGRNQEIALSAAEGISGMPNVAVFSVGSDGTDGPCDAAGGYADGTAKDKLESAGKKIYDVLRANDAYNALKLTDGLIITGPTGTNVNDVAVLLIKE